jgi:hypothetical protein
MNLQADPAVQPQRLEDHERGADGALLDVVRGQHPGVLGDDRGGGPLVVADRLEVASDRLCQCGAQLILLSLAFSKRRQRGTLSRARARRAQASRRLGRLTPIDPDPFNPYSIGQLANLIVVAWVGGRAALRVDLTLSVNRNYT